MRSAFAPSAATARWADARGSALPIALMAAALLSSLGSALVLLGVTESAIAFGYRRDMQMFYAVESALARVHADLEVLPDWTEATGGLVVSTLTDGDPGAVRAIGDAAVDLRGVTADLNASGAPPSWPPDRVPEWQLFGWGSADVLFGAVGGAHILPLYVAVWIHALPDEGEAGVPDGRTSMIRLHARAYGPAGARRRAEVTLVRPSGRRSETRSWHEVR